MNFSFTLRRVLAVALTAIVATGIASGQSTFGTILGTVRDQSGAVMPGSAVTFDNVGTGTKPAMLSASIDGISSIGPRSSAVQLQI